jgi:tellurite resistance protein TehA-like permease
LQTNKFCGNQGVYTNAAVELGKLLDAPAFNAWSTVLAVTLVIIWFVNILLTVRGVVRGKILGLSHGLSGRYYDDEVAQ